MIFFVDQHNALSVLSIHEYVRLPAAVVDHSRVFLSMEAYEAWKKQAEEKAKNRT